MDDSWKQDPRLKSMSREKIELLTRFSERLKSADKNSLAEALASINREARQKGLSFNDQENRPYGEHFERPHASLRAEKAEPSENAGKKAGRSSLSGNRLHKI